MYKRFIKLIDKMTKEISERQVVGFSACNATKTLSAVDFNNTFFKLKVEDINNNSFVVDCHMAIPEFK